MYIHHHSYFSCTTPSAAAVQSKNTPQSYIVETMHKKDTACLQLGKYGSREVHTMHSKWIFKVYNR